MYFEELKNVAHKHGYNLCIHGSMNRDFDLVAFPWADEVNEKHFEMINEMRKYLGGQFNAANNNGDLSNTNKHGRISYCINIHRNTPFTDEKDAEYYLDIAIFPSASWQSSQHPSPAKHVIDFTEWTFTEGYRQGELCVWWHYSEDSLPWREKNKLTTAELYELFIQSKNK